VPNFTDSKADWFENGSRDPDYSHWELVCHPKVSNLAFDIFYLYTKFGDSRYSRSRDMIAGNETENKKWVM